MIERVPWDQFLKDFRWNQGEHIAIIAPPGAGKTTLMSAIKHKRKFNIVFGTKKADPLYNQLIKEGYRHIQSFDDIKHYDQNLLLWPTYSGNITQWMSRQEAVFLHALNGIVRDGGWTLWIDETKYASEMLSLRKEISFCVDQLRSNNSSIICGAQRPSWLPQSVLANASHVFLWKSTNREDQIKLADVGGIDAKVVRDEAKSLGSHEFIYIKTRGVNSKMVISQVRK